MDSKNIGGKQVGKGGRSLTMSSKRGSPKNIGGKQGGRARCRPALTNWYGSMSKDMVPQYHNPCFKDHGIAIPFRGLIVGGSGSGKTTLVLELLHRMYDTFGHVTIYTMNADEPLYKFLKSKIKPEQLDIREGYNSITPPESMDKDLQHLVVFDDLVLEKDQTKIAEYFIRGRKVAKGISCLYLTQSYFGAPKVIRLQCTFVMVKKLMSTRDLNMLLRDFSLDCTKEQLHALYKHCVDKNQRDFLMVDLSAPEENRFRYNFSPIISVDSSCTVHECS